MCIFVYIIVDILCIIVYNIIKERGNDMNARKQTIKELEKAGYILKRNGANHDIYYNPDTKSTIPVKRHDFNDNDKRYILKEANIGGK